MAHVEDRWYRESKRLDADGKPVRLKSPRHGSGLRWLAQWVESDGKRHSKSFRTKDEAQAHLGRVKLAQQEGRHVESHKRTVKDYAEEWLDAQHHLVNPRTELVMRSRWTNNIEPALGSMRLRDVTKRHVQDVVQTWRTKGLSVATINGNYVYLNAIFTAAAKERVIAANPCEEIQVRGPKRPRIDPLRTDQVWEIARRIHPRFQALVLLAASTGMRSGELRGLTVDRISTGSPARIRIDRQLVSTTPTWDVTKTDRSARNITIDRHTLDIIDWHRYRVPPHPTGLLFTGISGAPLNPAVISAHLRSIAKTMDLPPRFGLHAFRHYHASLLIAAGMSPTAVAARLGHSNPSLTLSVYSHLWLDDEDRSRAAIEAGMFG